MNAILTAPSAPAGTRGTDSPQLSPGQVVDLVAATCAAAGRPAYAVIAYWSHTDRTRIREVDVHLFDNDNPSPAVALDILARLGATEPSTRRNSPTSDLYVVTGTPTTLGFPVAVLVRVAAEVSRG